MSTTKSEIPHSFPRDIFLRTTTSTIPSYLKSAWIKIIFYTHRQYVPDLDTKDIFFSSPVTRDNVKINTSLIFLKLNLTALPA